VNQRDFKKYYPKYRTAIAGIARKLGGRDDELVRDLEQEGALALLQLDPARATKNADAWVRQAMKNRMVDFLRKYNPRLYESLDARLEAGDQLEQSEGTTMHLISARQQLPRLIDETLWEDLEENTE
jgi:DNA-directed RNA polymerase specialized sigma24 family protein